MFVETAPITRSLTLNRLSDNVGGVKHISSVLVRALGRARHFALVEELPYQPRLARNRFQVRTQSDPCISSVATSIMITSSDSPLQGAERPINYSVFDCTPWRFPGCPACEPNLVN